VTGRQETRSKQLMDDRKENRRDWKLKYEAPDLRTLRITRFGKGYGPVERQTTERMIIKCYILRFALHSERNPQH